MPPHAERPHGLESPPGPEVVVDGRRCTYFGGTGYLGIQARPELADAADEAMRRFGLHPATSRAGLGETGPLRDAEAEAAAFFATEAAWLLPSGWLGPQVLVGAHGGRNDRLYVDQDAHFALRDAARLAGRPVVGFEHRDADVLRARIGATLRGGERPVVLTDGVFPISGRIAPLAAYVDVLAGYDGAALVVDDAHGFGVLGEHGRGSVEHAGVGRDRGVLVTGTASKALGGYGGLLCGSADATLRLRETSHWFEGSTPLPAPVAAATAAALRIARTEPELRGRLRDNVATVRAGLRALGLTVEDLPTPMIPIVLADAAAMRRLADRLLADGVLVPYLARYAGLGGAGALRIAVFATHGKEHVERLLDGFRRHL